MIHNRFAPHRVKVVGTTTFDGNCNLDAHPVYAAVRNGRTSRSCCIQGYEMETRRSRYFQPADLVNIHGGKAYARCAFLPHVRRNDGRNLLRRLLVDCSSANYPPRWREREKERTRDTTNGNNRSERFAITAAAAIRRVVFLDNSRLFR